MSHWRNSKEYKRLLERAHRMERLGQFNTSHHERLEQYIQSKKGASRKPKKQEDINE